MAIASSFGILSNEKIQATRRASSLLAALPQGAANALFEIIAGTKPPGGQDSLFHPHDHCKHGVSLPRASLYSFATGSDGTAWQVTAVNTIWRHFDRGSSGVTTLDHGKGIYDIALYVTPGIDSATEDKIGTSNPVVLEAKVSIFSSTGTSYVRIFNRTTGTYSSSASTVTTSAIARLSLTDIPVKGGCWNMLDVEFSTTAGSSFIILVDLSIAETRTSSQPKSSGSSIMTSLSKP